MKMIRVIKAKKDLLNGQDGYNLIFDKEIKENTEIFDQAIKQVLQNEIDNSSLIRDGIFKNDYEINEARHKYNIRYKGYYN